MKKNIFRNTVCILLCLLMLSGGFLVSCNKNEEPAGDNSGAGTEEKVTVVRLKENIKYGSKVTEAKIEEVQVNKADLPEGTILNKSDVLGKFTTTEMYAGEYFLPVKLADKRPTNVDENGDTVYEMYEEAIDEAVQGKIDHISFVSNDIEADYAYCKDQGYAMATEQIEAIPSFWEKGCRYFKLATPTGEQVEFCQIL